jgi:hypothetical protein
MNTDISGLSVEVATDLLKSHLSKRISTQERILFLQHQLKELKKKDKLSEEDEKLKEEIPINIARFEEGIAESDIHVKNFEKIMKELTTRQQGEK